MPNRRHPKTRKSKKSGKKRKATRPIRSRRPRGVNQRPPRTAKEYFAKPRRYQEQWDLAVQVPAEMRIGGLTLHQAAERSGIDPAEVIKLIPSAFRKKGRKYAVKRWDRLLRILLIPGKKGLREIATRDSRQASIVGRYWNAVERAIGPEGDDTDLRNFRPKTVKDAAGRRVRLLTDLDELKRQASAGMLHFESLYGRAA